MCEVVLCRSLVQDDVDNDASQSSRVQIPDHGAVCESVCYDSDQLLDRKQTNTVKTRCIEGAGMKITVPPACTV